MSCANSNKETITWCSGESGWRARNQDGTIVIWPDAVNGKFCEPCARELERSRPG